MTGQSRELRLEEGEVLLVDKPKGWTSFDVVHRIRHLFHVRKVGHAGTLDPMATGLLIVCVGKKTKEIVAYVGMEKEYDAEMTLGGRTESYDAETPVIETRPLDGITADRVTEVLGQFVGPQAQVPPMWSAASVDGTRLYKLARKGQVVERKPREIIVHSITPTSVALPLVSFTAVCSKGTYIRGLVNDMGLKLGCGAYLSGLVRTRIGPYRLADAFTMTELDALKAAQGAAPA